MALNCKIVKKKQTKDKNISRKRVPLQLFGGKEVK